MDLPSDGAGYPGEVTSGCVPLPEWTGMDIFTGTDYRNGHYAIALDGLDIFYLNKMSSVVI